MQQQAAVELIKLLMNSRRATEQDLWEAQRRLDELMDLQPSEAIASAPEVPQQPSEPVSVDPLVSRALMDKIDEAQKRLGQVCNSMHEVPKDEPCPHLMAQAASVKEEVEDLWTQYRYLQRNGRLPDSVQDEEKLSTKRSYELLEAIAEKKKVSEKRSKLKKKIADPRNLRSKLLDTWKEELAQADNDYAHYVDMIKILKG
jgi:hypothetical protein